MRTHTPPASSPLLRAARLPTASRVTTVVLASAFVFVVLVFVPAPAAAGEALPPGPPWKTDWLDAKAEAIRTGRPIFAYFTKKH